MINQKCGRIYNIYKKAEKMFEAKLQEGALLKKIVESIKDLVTEVNFDTTATGEWTPLTPTGISMQAMDASHVALVSLNMGIDLF